MAPGVLYVVATPIGNLGDVTARAREVLGGVDRVAAEDTRRTGRLLAALGLDASLISYHDHNEERRAPELVGRLLEGRSIALVTDAGTPGISDPAYRLVHEAIEAGIRIEAIPGPSAVLAALVVSGLPMDRFVFEGFPPRRPSRLRQLLEALEPLPHSLVFYEGPKRVAKLLRSVFEVLGDRRIAVCRELTKLHEEVWRGQVSAWLDDESDRALRGEVTVVVAGRSKRRAGGGPAV